LGYQVLIVDDETPALSLLQMQIRKHAPDFSTAQTCTSGEAALTYLRENTVDLLIADIAMPRMNGIELALAARTLQPDIHIFIISGYAEFAYAQNAIQASVDEYLLKPISGPSLRSALDRLRTRLDRDRILQAASLLPALACGLPHDHESMLRYFVSTTYWFALVRWNGIDPQMNRRLHGSSMVLPADPRFYVLRGRDENEEIIIYPDCEQERFLSEVRSFMSRRSGCPTWTAVYQSQPYPLVMLDHFIAHAASVQQNTSVLGRHQVIPMDPTGVSRIPKAEPLLTVSELNQLQFYCSAGRYSHIKDFFKSFSASLEQRAVSEMRVYQVMRQIILQFTGNLSILKNDFESTRSRIFDLFVTAPSYSSLFASAYSILFDSEDNLRNRKLTTKELYDSAVSYIEQNYARPMNVQSVCDELGISPTYLSRLFRKYGDTTFNTSLITKRMEAAIVLLSEKPDMLLRDVAACVGYEDSSYFAKVFYQFTGTKPSKYAARDKTDN